MTLKVTNNQHGWLP